MYKRQAEYDVIRFDELTHFTEYQYLYLISRVRGTNGYPKQVKSTTNPGGIGHTWVRSRFVDVAPPGCMSVSYTHLYTFIGTYETRGYGASVTKNMRSGGVPKKVIFKNATAITNSEYFKPTIYHDENADSSDISEDYLYYSYYMNGVARSMYSIFTTSDGGEAMANGKLCLLYTSYVYVGVFLAMSALLCCYTTLQSLTYDTRTYFTYMIFALVVLIPLLTMRLFSEEKKLRTEQMLMTAPVSLTGMVLGKFLAAFTLFTGTLLVSCVNFFPLYAIASDERNASSLSSDAVSYTHLICARSLRIRVFFRAA